MTLRHNSFTVYTLVFLLTIGTVCQLPATIIFQDDFDGGSGTNLHGTTPDITTGGASWTANSTFKADGSVSTSGGNQASASLPFTPQAGKIYELTVVFENTTDNNDWLSAAFCELQDTEQAFVGLNSYGTAWHKIDTASGKENLTVAAGMGTDGVESHGSSTGETFPGRVRFQATLDATDSNSANWIMDFSGGALSPESSDAFTFADQPAVSGNYGDINYVLLSRADYGGGHYDSLTLEVIPEPVSLSAWLLSGLGWFGWHRGIRKNRAK